LPVAAQEPAKVWRIGVLVSSSASLNASRDDALRQGLREMGYVEGKNIIMEYRYAEGKLDRLSELAADLVRSRPDLILVGGTRVAVAAKQATSVIPIVVTGAGDLVAAGVVHSLSLPGGNVTGVSRLSPEFLGTRVELLKEIIPKATRIATLSNPENPGHAAGLREIELDALAWGIRLQPLAARGADDLIGAFRAAAKEGVDALIVMVDALFSSQRSRIVELALKQRLPAIYDRAEFVAAGGPEEIMWNSKPHVGTFRLVTIVEGIRAKIEALGGEYRFETKVASVDIATSKSGGRKVRAVILENGDAIAASHVVLAMVMQNLHLVIEICQL